MNRTQIKGSYRRRLIHRYGAVKKDNCEFLEGEPCYCY